MSFALVTIPETVWSLAGELVRTPMVHYSVRRVVPVLSLESTHTHTYCFLIWKRPQNGQDAGSLLAVDLARPPGLPGLSVCEVDMRFAAPN